MCNDESSHQGGTEDELSYTSVDGSKQVFWRTRVVQRIKAKRSAAVKVGSSKLRLIVLAAEILSLGIQAAGSWGSAEELSNIE